MKKAKVKYKAIIFVFVVSLSMVSSAQQSLIGETKKAISGLSMTVDSYNKAFNKLKPALTHEQTAEQAETWALANRIKTEQFDKYMDYRRVGKKIDIKAMGLTLLDAYDYGIKAMSLDTVRVLDKRGEPVMDKRTKRPKIKTKYSKDVLNRMLEHHDNYRTMGSELYNVKDWDGAYRAWDYYCQSPIVSLPRCVIIKASLPGKKPIP